MPYFGIEYNDYIDAMVVNYYKDIPSPVPIRAAILTMTKHPDFKKDMAALHDFRKVYLDISYDQVEDLVEFIKEISYKRGDSYISALVVTSELAFGIMTMLTMLLENANVTLEIFTDLTVAKAWLRTKGVVNKLVTPPFMGAVV